jgi:mannonate dehydratase
VSAANPNTPTQGINIEEMVSGGVVVLRLLNSNSPPQLLQVDHHTHIVGTGDSGSGCYLNSEIFSVKHPISYIKMRAFMSGTGLHDFRDADESMVARLVQLIGASNLDNEKARHGRNFILAFDEVYEEDGRKAVEKSTFHVRLRTSPLTPVVFPAHPFSAQVPNDYILRLARTHPDHFLPCVSVHPYRKDAISELRRCARAGARLVKWLPNSMFIDPTHEKCGPFFEAMKELDMVLLCHVGEVTPNEDAIVSA